MRGSDLRSPVTAPDPHAVLRPRAAAVLCALRRKPLSPVQLSHAIGDGSVPDTRELLAAMSNPRDPAGATVALIKQYVELTDAGVAWLECHGLPVRRRAEIAAQTPTMAELAAFLGS